MKLPIHTTSSPIVGKEARKVMNAVNSGRSLSNARAKMFAAEIVAELVGCSGKKCKSTVSPND